MELIIERDVILYVTEMILGMSFRYMFKYPFFKKLDKTEFLDIILRGKTLRQNGSVV